MDGQDKLLSVGIDIGTTTTHLVVTSLSFGNLARPTQIEQLGITDKEVLFESPIFETPLTTDGQIDARAVAQLIQDVYQKAAQEANLDMNSVQTGAVIITGESARTRNAQAVIEEVARFAGEFVVESAGPDLESIYCARGSGAQSLSKDEGKRVLNVDIGGGTSNFALIEDGEIIFTGAMSIGGRAVRFRDGEIAHISEGAAFVCEKYKISLSPGDKINDSGHQLFYLSTLMADILADYTSTKKHLKAQHDELWITSPLFLEKPVDLIMFSGGVAAIMEEFRLDYSGEYPELKTKKEAKPFKDTRPNPNDFKNKREREKAILERKEINRRLDWEFMQRLEFDRHQDLGPLLAYNLRSTLMLGKPPIILATNAIRATVLGAGMHTLQLTGSTIDFAEQCLPLRNVPIIRIDTKDLDNLTPRIKRSLDLKQIDWSATPVALSLTGLDRNQLQYPRIKKIAESLARTQADLNAAEPFVVTVDQDIAMVLGQLLKRLAPDKRIISVDGVQIADGDYLDIGKAVHSNSLSDRYTHTLPVVVKTLIFYKN